MRAVEIEKLVGEYVTVRFIDGAETVRLLGIRDPDAREVQYGHSSKRVDVRRFLLGGYRDTWVLPRDVLGAAEPDQATLNIIEHVENVVGAKAQL
jgi:hypothetical protein